MIPRFSPPLRCSSFTFAATLAALALQLGGCAGVARAQELLSDPSFEKTQPINQFGQVFPDWLGWIYDRPARFEVSKIAHSGQTSALIVDDGGKIRIYSGEMALPPGRYQMKFFMRGLDVSGGTRPIDFSMGYDGRFLPIAKSGTFGWTPVRYVFDYTANEKTKARAYIGLTTRGRLWVDDASLTAVDVNVPLTPGPVAGEEEAPITPTAALTADARPCPNCLYLNNPGITRCYACGQELATAKAVTTGPAELELADFEDGTMGPFGRPAASAIVAEHATSGKQALRLDKGFVSIDRPANNPLDWSSYDEIHFDVFNPSTEAVILTLELRDPDSRTYWTRVNLSTLAPPGPSTVTIPTHLYVGEKSKPGRKLNTAGITRFLISVGQNGPLYLDNFRLVRLDTAKYQFPELRALDFGPYDGPLMDGFQRAGDLMDYSPSRGLGWIKPHFWRNFDVLQPDALTQDFVCAFDSTFRFDLPNGKYQLAMTIDSPGGYWGEVQRFTHRQILANGRPLLTEDNDFKTFKANYFRNAHREDLPGEDTFDAYTDKAVPVRRFEVEVTDGHLDLQFKGGTNWEYCLSSLVLFPSAKQAQGDAFLKWVHDRRRTQFDNAFKRLVVAPSGAAAPENGVRVFARPFSSLPGPQEGPRPGESLAPEGLTLAVTPDEEGPLTFSVQAGKAPVSVQALRFKNGATTLDPAALQLGYMDYRLQRVTADGSVYTTGPRYWHPVPAPDAPGITRTYWVRVRVPKGAAPGTYRGGFTVASGGTTQTVPVTIRVLPFQLDTITDVAAGPFGCTMSVPWLDEANTDTWNWALFEKSVQALQAAGCTTLSGVPTLTAKARGGKIELDTARADKEMQFLRAHGFNTLVSSYGSGANLGYKLYGSPAGPDETAAKTAGFPDAASFLKALYGTIDQHAVQANWPTVDWNICDEPIESALAGATKNALVHRAAGEGLRRTTFTGATSMTGNAPDNPHIGLVKAMPIPALNLHDADSIGVLHDAGNRFCFYNGVSRWAYGAYMKMLVRRYQLAQRLSWHYNVVAGDPYNPLDCREDDYCWFNTDNDQNLVPSRLFLQEVQPGLNDYRYFSTLERLLKQNSNHPAAAKGRAVLDKIDALVAGKDRNAPSPAEAEALRSECITAIETLSAK